MSVNADRGKGRRRGSAPGFIVQTGCGEEGKGAGHGDSLPYGRFPCGSNGGRDLPFGRAPSAGQRREGARGRRKARLTDGVGSAVREKKTRAGAR